jgi:hypothetical protein
VYCAINPFTMIVIPAPIFIGINSSRNPEKQSPAFAGAASRRQAGCRIKCGMTCQPKVKKRWTHNISMEGCG